MRDFGEILAENRKKKGYSQSNLVDLLSQEGIQVTTKAISKWETNAREPALHVFLTLCQLLDIEDIYESFFGENPYNIMSGLNEEGRNKLIEFADILKASKKFSPLSAKIIPFHHPCLLYTSSLQSIIFICKASIALYWLHRNTAEFLSHKESSAA